MRPIEVESLAGQDADGSEITHISFDLWTLRITLKVKGRPMPTYVEFEGVSGFRVLDEGDLLEFWAQDVSKPGWLWLVRSGGWRDLESTRSGFIRRDVPSLREYMVLGVNDCVNVLSGCTPKVLSPEP